MEYALIWTWLQTPLHCSPSSWVVASLGSFDGEAALGTPMLPAPLGSCWDLGKLWTRWQIAAKVCVVTSDRGKVREREREKQKERKREYMQLTMM